jgi:hypothetical protein
MIDGGGVSKEIEEQVDHVIPRASERAAQFLGVIQKTCVEEGLELDLQPTKRGWRDETIVLRGTIRAGRNNELQLEVFADPQGNSLHVGWQALRAIAGGQALGGIGLFGEINGRRMKAAGKSDNQRALSGILQAFNGMVYMPVVQQLTEAIRAEQGQRQNGFLGA